MPEMNLTEEERAMLRGDRGRAVQFAMEVVCAFGAAQAAQALIPIRGAQIGSAWYSGEAQRDFVAAMHRDGARVSVPTCLAASRVCLATPGLDRDPVIAEHSRQMASQLVEMGCRPTFTCSPYLEGIRPPLGANVAWSESSAVVFANSVLGARTNQGYDFVDLAMAIIGRAPEAGLYLASNRRATVVIDVSGLPAPLLSSAILYPILGRYVGKEHDQSVPLFVGFPATVTDADQRALGAMLATAGSIRMFHVLARTPEAPDMMSACQGQRVETVRVGAADLHSHREALSPGTAGERLQAVCLGAPHISVDEFALVREILKGRCVAEGVVFSISASRATLAELARRGWRAELEQSGVRLIADTCTYLGLVDVGQRGLVMTHSGKWAYYARMIYPVVPLLGSLAECVASAIAGRVIRDAEFWSDHLWA